MTEPKAYYSIGIAGLPNPVRTMISGKAYAINVQQASAASACFDSSIAAALDAQRRAIAVIRTPAAEFLKRLGRLGINTAEVIQQNRLLILQKSDRQGEKLLRHGARHFTDELDYFSASRESLFAVENAEDLFTLDDPHLAGEQAKIYQEWYQSTRATALLFFSIARINGPQIAALRTLSDVFAGLVEFGQAGIQLSWRVNHWQSPFASLSHREYAIGFDSQGTRLVAAGYQLEGLDVQIRHAPDQDRIITTEAVVQGERGIPTNWRIVDDLDALLEAAEGSVAATCLIDFVNGDKLHLLARAVHHLRQKHGPGLRIIIRERKLRLRYSDELLLLRLGANSVVYAEVNFSRFISLIDSLRDQIYTGTVPNHFEDAVHAAMPPPHIGYLNPQAFCDMVRDTLAQSARIGIESTLAYLCLLPEIAHVDALRLLKIKRQGDLFTADHRGIWIFLYACREPDADATLERLYAHPLTQAFEGQIRYFSSVSIQAAIDRLEGSLYTTPVADFTAQLEQPSSLGKSALRRPDEWVIDDSKPVVLGQINLQQKEQPAPDRQVSRAHLQLANPGQPR